MDQLDEDAKLAARLADEDNCTTSDAALALILQKQFDLEYDSQLKKREERLNRQSKVGISLDKFKRSTSSNSANTVCQEDDLYEDYDDDVSYHDSNIESDHRDNFEIYNVHRKVGRSGFYIDKQGNMITKHDIPTSGRKNVCRLMELKTDIETGDASSSKDDFKITNYVYNKLKVHSKKSSRRAAQRLFDKKERDNEAILDAIATLQTCKMSVATRAIMDGLLIAYKIEKLNGVVGQGKESIILHGTGRDHEDNPGQEIAIKIFKTDNNVAFKTRDTYNKSKCPSYKFDKPRSKNDSLNKWAERGFKNLKLLRKANVNCPDAISLKKHVLVMTFLGTDASPSPQLKDANLDELQLRSSYEQVVDIMDKMYNECDLIHGDLSEYNLLWQDGKVFVIDVSQSMFTSHPNANGFLYRDCKNILDFYRKSGLSNILDEKSLFMLICGKDLESKDVELWSKIEDFPSNEKLMQRDENMRERCGISTDKFVQIIESTGKSHPVTKA